MSRSLGDGVPFALQALDELQYDSYRRWVKGAIALAAAGYGVVTVSGQLIQGLSLFNLFSQGTAFLACLAALFLAGRDRLGTAAALALGAIWIEQQTGIPFRGAAISSVIVFPAVVIASGLLLGGRWAYRVAALTTVSVSGVTLFGHVLLGTPSADPGYEAYLIVLMSAVNFGTAALVDLSMKTLGSVVVSAMSSEQRLAELVRHAPDGIVAIAPDGTIQSANPAAARLLSQPEEDLVGRAAVAALAERLSGEDPISVAAELIGSGTDQTLDFVGRGRTPLKVDATTTRYHRRDGSEGIQLTLHDATERVRDEEQERTLREQLERSNRLDSIGRLAGGLAHDFGVHLTEIGSSAQMLLSGEGTDTRRLARTILEAKMRAAVLTSRLQAFARKGVTHPRVLTLHEVLADSAPLFESLVGERIRLEVTTGETPPVLADRNQIEQCLVNLITNAADALEGVGSVSITTAAPGAPSESALSAGRVVPDGFVEIRVEDAGHGMDGEAAARAFEPFFTTNAVGDRPGLGLATVHGIVSQNGGHVGLESEPGLGTCVRIHWPVHRP